MTLSYGDRLYLTDEEFKAAQARAEQTQKQRASGALPSSESGAAIRQTSLIVDPPNGQFPPLTDYGKQLQSKMNSTYKPGKDAEGSYDGIEDFGPWDRCITRGLPVSMEPRNYNNGIRITQSPGFVIITVEMAHEARIIPTTPMPKLDSAIKEWLGESRGHWEGNTLVIETTNFNGQTELTSAGVPGSPGPLQPSSTSMTTIERITRTGPDTGGVLDQGYRSDGTRNGILYGGVSHDARQQLSDVRVCLPRRQYGRPQLHRNCTLR